MEQEQPKPLTERSHRCVHTEEERCLIGTWPAPELQEAINRGYVIRHVYEVWHFPSKSNRMFSSYVNTFLKMKQEASGWPEWVEDDEDKRVQYVQDYLDKEGVQLEPTNIQKNPGRRSLAKMMLNSFWGKYGQQGNKSQVEAISEPSRLHELLNDDTHIVQTLRVMIELVYKQVDDEESVPANINIFVACLTTCWARLKFYREGPAKYPLKASSTSTRTPSSSRIDPANPTLPRAIISANSPANSNPAIKSSSLLPLYQELRIPNQRWESRM